MRALVLALALVVLPAAGEEKAPPGKRSPAAKAPRKAAPAPKAHTKPTPDQVLRFQDLEKKKQGKGP